MKATGIVRRIEEYGIRTSRRIRKPVFGGLPGRRRGIFAVFSISCIIFLFVSGITVLMDWIFGFIWLFATFMIMEFFVWRTAGISPKEFSSKARSVIFNKD